MKKAHSSNPNPSHQFDFSGREALRVIAAPFAALALLVVGLHTVAVLDWWPQAVPVEDTEQTLMRHRVTMLHADHPARVLIVGDSSSAVSIDARQLSAQLPGNPPVLNQGLFMAVSLDVFGEAATRFMADHPNQVDLVILLVTTDKLRSPSVNPYFQQLWREMVDDAEPESGETPATALVQLEFVRERLLAKFIPFATYGRIGRFYGGHYHLRKQLAISDGSMIENGWYNPSPTLHPPNWEVSAAVMAEAAKFRAAFPGETALVVGIAPVPESLAPPSFTAVRNQLLEQLNSVLEADLVLTNLPARFPNGYCSSTIHLNPRGQAHFTRLLAEELAETLR